MSRRERSTGDDGLRRILYILVKASGEEDLAVTAKEIKSSGGHYSYHAVSTCPLASSSLALARLLHLHLPVVAESLTGIARLQADKFGPRVWKNGAEVRRWLVTMAPRGDLSAPEGSVHNPARLHRCWPSRIRVADSPTITTAVNVPAGPVCTSSKLVTAWTCGVTMISSGNVNCMQAAAAC